MIKSKAYNLCLSYLIIVFSVFNLNIPFLESFRPPIFSTGPEKDGFSLGRKANFAEIFGEVRSKWLLPVHSRYDFYLYVGLLNFFSFAENDMRHTSYIQVLFCNMQYFNLNHNIFKINKVTLTNQKCF